MREVYGLLVKQWPGQLNFGQTNINLLQVTLIQYRFEHVVPPTQRVLEDWSCRKKTSGTKKAAERVLVLCWLVFFFLKGNGPFNHHYAPIHKPLNWTLREERLNWQIPGEGEITSHVSKTVLIWLCAQWLQQQVSQTGERSDGGEGCNMQSASKIKPTQDRGARSSLTTSLRKQRQAATTQMANFRAAARSKAQDVTGACDLHGWHKVATWERRPTWKSFKPNQSGLCPLWALAII